MKLRYQQAVADCCDPTAKGSRISLKPVVHLRCGMPSHSEPRFSSALACCLSWVEQTVRIVRSKPIVASSHYAATTSKALLSRPHARSQPGGAATRPTRRAGTRSSARASERRVCCLLARPRVRGWHAHSSSSSLCCGRMIAEQVVGLAAPGNCRQLACVLAFWRAAGRRARRHLDTTASLEGSRRA
jgi:hypothetical protein